METFSGGKPAPILSRPRFERHFIAALYLAPVFDCRLHNLRPANLLHQFGNVTVLDELRPNIFREDSELFHVIGIGEKAAQKMKAPNKARQSIDEGLPVLKRGKLFLEPRPQGVHSELYLGIRSRSQLADKGGSVVLREKHPLQGFLHAI